ncbi:undecaprenyldiphospho-muramoylpentapeptide beta-N-acetylglucosaminyltransferase [Helicobacter cetorum]|uniref:UDP-N-acetylglucosamine--N-acetylmuramyl-(pentapeptide) pyrophosphoryl-undecaprenol N-acetylglucosamine transferase n=1 Tax=Helicobacter cetorum (strain ATCC BAA-540 / CCUG 52418 / MIT 99-5656) TaxID=1163745 RepID=I0EUD9_HELCM|nr:undecaprenyldiphospho-muramoylpentapeptide beta-N-acetylglucosaminyltransferase [Helicobacter cetorum]AFI06558.1 undecaprenyldiphospho-muramoylpentapeptide beta-N- acetylglucosaminyltransferase [Helicobacter cetorum MIT 99-5656]
MKIALTGGGTGGHLSIAKALAIELKNQGISTIYLGSISGQDREWFENSPLFEACYFFNTKGVVNKSLFKKLGSLFLQVRAALKARKILKKHKITQTISVGGFSAGPASFASLLNDTPLYIHEQNAIKGTLNRYLSPKARAIFSSYSFKDKGSHILTPYPVQNAFFDLARTRTEIKHILFLGGSQGARAINEFALLNALKLTKKGINITHICGKDSYEKMRSYYQDLELLDKVELFAFHTNIVEVMHKADLCVSRAGASSVWELCANGLPTLFIPYPFASHNHQYHNVLEFEKENLSYIVPQNELLPKKLFEVIRRLNQLDEEGHKNIANTSEQLQQKIAKNGVKTIIEYILNSETPLAKARSFLTKAPY